MLPIDMPTVFLLVLVSVGLSGALALQFGWRYGLSFLALATAFPAGLLWLDPPTGQYAGLGYVVVICASLVAFVVGAAVGGVLRYAGLSLPISVGVLTCVCLCAAGLLLQRQFVPSGCLDAPLQVRIAGQILRIPVELKPRLESGNRIYQFGRMDRKSDFAQLCRKSRSGTRVLNMETVWISPAATHKTLTSLCSQSDAPDWCSQYSAEPYRLLRQVLIAPKNRPGFPMLYWKEGGYLAKDRQGTLENGSICLLPDDGGRTQCWVWQAFGEGARITVSTNNLDPRFDGMPIEEARDMIEQVRGDVLSILQ